LASALVLIAGASRTERGLFILHGTALRTIDVLPTLALARHEKLLYRVIGSSDAAACDDLLVYDEVGIRRTIRLDGVAGTRRLLAHGRGLTLATRDGNAYKVARDGTMTLAAAHERFIPGLAEGAVRALRDGWLVCDADASEVALHDDAGALVTRTRLEGSPCALAVDRQRAYVYERSDARAVLTVLALPRLQILERTELELEEIEDLAVVPAELAAGVRIGSRTNSTRAQQEDQLAMFARAGVRPSRLWATGDPLPPWSSLRVRIRALLPREVSAGEILELPVIVENESDAILVSALPNPTQICYRWFADGGRAVDAGSWIHTPLPRSLVPSSTLEAMVRIAAPEAAGRYVLSVTLLQMDVAWFDDLDPSNATRGDVVVV